MRAVLFDRHGPPEVLRLAELPAPQPGPGQIRVRVRSVGVQPFDALVRSGDLPVPVRFPQQLGNEFAGIIDQLGPGVQSWSLGDPVVGWANMASLADQVVTDDDAVVAKPGSLSWEAAGALGASGQTALTALDELALRADETLLIHGAAGGAGSAAAQIARARGIHVVGTAREVNHPHLRALGATPVTYGPGLRDRVRRAAPDGLDAALHAVGGDTLQISLQLVAQPSRIATLVDHDQAETLGVRGVRARRDAAQLRELVRLHQQDLLQVPIRARYRLEEIVEAHRAVETGHGRGKVIIRLETPA